MLSAGCWIIALANLSLLLGAEESPYWQSYALSYAQTAEAGATAPTTWQTRDWLTVGGIILTGAGLYLADEPINELVLHNRNEFTRMLASAGNTLGDGKYILAGWALTGTGGYLRQDTKTLDTALIGIKSFLLAGGVSFVVKCAVQRSRPDPADSKTFWQDGTFSWKHDSFPSGHSVVAWSTATTLAEQYQELSWVPWLAYSTAALTSYARLHDNKHWASDVFAGAVIGHFTTRLVLQTTPRLSLIAGRDGSTLLLNYCQTFN